MMPSIGFRPSQQPSISLKQPLPSLAFQGNDNSNPPSPPPNDSTQELINAGATLIGRFLGEDAKAKFLNVAQMFTQPAPKAETSTPKSEAPPAPVVSTQPANTADPLNTILNNIADGNFKQKSVWRDWSENSGDFTGSNCTFSTNIEGQERTFIVSYHYNIHRKNIGYSLVEDNKAGNVATPIKIEHVESGIAQQVHQALKEKVGHIVKLPLEVSVSEQTQADQTISSVLGPVINGVNTGASKYVQSFQDIHYNYDNFDAIHEVKIPINGKEQPFCFTIHRELTRSYDGFSLSSHFFEKMANREQRSHAPDDVAYFKLKVANNRIELNYKEDTPEGKYRTVQSDNPALVDQLNRMFSSLQARVKASK